MTNEIQMTNFSTSVSDAVAFHRNALQLFGFHDSFVIKHSSFVISRNVGACTFGKASPARSGRPPRETTAATPCESSAAATSAAAPPVLEPKYPIRRLCVCSCCVAHFVACTRRSASKLMLNRCSRVYSSRSAHARHKNLSRNRR